MLIKRKINFKKNNFVIFVNRWLIIDLNTIHIDLNISKVKIVISFFTLSNEMVRTLDEEPE